MGIDDKIKQPYEAKNKLEPSEAVNHPLHYMPGVYEVIKVIEAWKLNFNLGNAIKYIGRIGRKSLPKQDIEKAIWYLQRELEKYETTKTLQSECQYYRDQKDSNNGVAICYCVHGKNLSEKEGNCIPSLCPFVDTIDWT